MGSTKDKLGVALQVVGSPRKEHRLWNFCSENSTQPCDVRVPTYLETNLASPGSPLRYLPLDLDPVGDSLHAKTSYLLAFIYICDFDFDKRTR